MNDDDEPKLWVTVLKLVIGLVVLIGGTGMVLKYFDKVQDRAESLVPASSGKGVDWGIAGDSPLKR